MAIRFLLESHYAEKREDESFWKPHVEAALRRSELPKESLKIISNDGTNVVFTYGADKFVKIYTPFFRGRESQGIEALALQAISRNSPRFICPKVILQGELSPESSDWKWPFVILSRVSGNPVVELSSTWSDDVWLAFAFQSGAFVAKLHKIGVTQELATQYKELQPGGFQEFLARQKEQALTSEVFSGLNLLEELKALDVTSLVSRWPVLVHGDFDGSHLFMNDSGFGLIDFGDVKLADPIWEFVTIADGFLGHSNSERLKVFLNGYGGKLEVFERFHLKLGAFALLHEWTTSKDIARWITASGATTIEELGRWFWPS